MVKRRLAAIALACCACAALAQTTAEQAARALADRYQREHDEVIRMFRSEPDYEEADQPDTLFFYNSKEMRTYLVTKPEHPAHPAVVIRRIERAGAGLMIDSQGIGRGDQEALRRWIRELDAQSRQDGGRRLEGISP